mmetsp:Transcript_16978/g.40953  ORF Transcript_16978/g.40953 Transcript_16978/m.40953 type:complete len:200 (+) Transcript_16978:2118-2717(+)
MGQDHGYDDEFNEPLHRRPHQRRIPGVRRCDAVQHRREAVQCRDAPVRPRHTPHRRLPGPDQAADRGHDSAIPHRPRIKGVDDPGEGREGKAGRLLLGSRSLLFGSRQSSAGPRNGLVLPRAGNEAVWQHPTGVRPGIPRTIPQGAESERHNGAVPQALAAHLPLALQRRQRSPLPARRAHLKRGRARLKSGRARIKSG